MRLRNENGEQLAATTIRHIEGWQSCSDSFKGANGWLKKAEAKHLRSLTGPVEDIVDPQLAEYLNYVGAR